MDLTIIQMAFIAVVTLAATAVVVFVDLRMKQRKRASRRRFKSHTHSVTRPERPIMVFETSPIDYTFAKKLSSERPLEPLVGTVTRFRPPVQLHARETVTVEMLSHDPAARPSPAAMLLAGDTCAVTLPAVTIDAALWERLLSSRPERNLLSSPDSVSESLHKTAAPHAQRSAHTIEASYRMIQDEVIQDDAHDAAFCHQPSGMIQQPVLDELLESRQPFTGLVVSISVNDSDSSMWHSQGLMQSVGAHIASLLEENDFSCRTSYDEFVMVCRGEQGARAQRRLNSISERLWDYQLRGLDACAVLFSWGAVEAQDQPLAEAIASAAERMRETKRSANAAKSALAHRQAV